MNLNFYCIGSSKCGTTTLHDILKQHPEVFLPEIKETKFLSLNYDKGLPWYYKEYFDKYNDEKAVGEIYPCLALEEAPKRLLESFGKDLKIFVIVRNPVSRLYSNYQGQLRINKISEPLDQAIISHPALIENSLYAKHIQRFKEYFPVENIKCFVFEEDFLNNRKQMMSDLCDFLGVAAYEFELNLNTNPTWQPKNKWLHKMIYARPKFINAIVNKFLKSKSLKQRIRIALTNMNAKKIPSKKLDFEFQKHLYFTHFEQDVKELEVLLNRDLSCWYKNYIKE